MRNLIGQGHDRRNDAELASLIAVIALRIRAWRIGPAAIHR